MAILSTETKLNSGERLTAQTVNDISETAVKAYKLAQDAIKKAETASTKITIIAAKGNDIY